MASTLEKTLTIAIPSYNVEDYLERCVTSLVNCDTSAKLDVLIIEDGSTDATAQVADRLVQQTPEIVRVVHKKNGHYGSAVNVAIESALGKFFRIVDADDYVDSVSLEKLVAYMQKNDDLDLILTDYVLCYENGEQELKSATTALCDGQTINFNDVQIETQLMHSMNVKTSVLQDYDIRLDPKVSFTDEEFSLYPIPYVNTVGYCSCPLYQYQIGREGQSISFAQLDKTIEQNYFVTNQIISWYEKLNKDNFSSAKRGYINQKVCDVVVTHIRKRMVAKNSGDYKEVVKELDRKVKKLPEVYELNRLRSLKLCRISHYLLWNTVCEKMKQNEKVLIS